MQLNASKDLSTITPGASWTPVIGEEGNSFLNSLQNGSGPKIRDETTRILARGIEPGEDRKTAGLVVGYVQSGKTTSFTAAAAVARDNGFGLVIIIAGTSNNLLNQTQQRLQQDLRLGQKDAYRRWVFVRSPKPGTEEANKVSARLEEWADDEAPASERATVLITVMKQHRHLASLIQMLEGLRPGLLDRLSALVIDDEADQASPNTRFRQGEESATYGRIRRLRATLPSHTLLEYTATPQATLLLSLIDELSPDFVSVIDPGSQYTGGKYFFQDHRTDFVRYIPSTDVLAIDTPNSGPPPTLQRAFATFALGCAAGSSTRSTDQRSMLVHPSQKTLPQATFVSWIKHMRDGWAELVVLPEGDLDRDDLIKGRLKPAYDDLAATCTEIPAFEDLLGTLARTLRKIQIEEINARAGKPAPVDWPTAYAWVLIGGTLLDRGFTVEGLTVTYMPRALGVGNADTVQQRARFFGYKASYANYCRAWLEPDVEQAFRSYVDHEESMRDELVRVATAGESLRDWKRVFLLDSRMRPTRQNVIQLETRRSTFAKKWFSQSSFDSVDQGLIASNRAIVDAFCATQRFADDSGDARRDPATQIHPAAEMQLETVLEGLLRDYVMMDEDAPQFAALRILLKDANDRGAESCRIHRMAAKTRQPRMRSLDRAGRIKNLFQGSNAATGYPGDRSIHEVDRVTIQIHRLELRGDDGTDDGARAQCIAEDVPVLAVWVPERMGLSVIVEI